MCLWQPTLKNVEGHAGVPGRAEPVENRCQGSEFDLVYIEKYKPVAVVEVCLEYKPPERFVCRYVSRGVVTDITNRFVSINPSTTDWQFTMNFSFHNPFVRLTSRMLQPAMKRRVIKDAEVLQRALNDHKDEEPVHEHMSR